MHSLSIFGTSSDAGKSTLAFAITTLLHRRGIMVAPFKAQNVSNNAQVCDSGGEIAQPQYFAAEAIGLKTTTDMNPVLIKSGSGSHAHLILNGEAVGEQHVLEYYRNIDVLKPIVNASFERLLQNYECIVAEGAGSPVELNLMDKDLSNIHIATEFNTKIILVADIQKGGVFASIYGVYNLLPKALQHNVIGVIVNKFRGDLSLFDEGVKIIEKEFGLKVLGVVGWRPFNLGFEDSASIENYVQDTRNATIKVGVISLPYISNYTDFEPLVADEEVELLFINSPAQARMCDLLILPGSKRVIEDLLWLEHHGFMPLLRSETQKIVGICGGYEMLHERILDPEGIESDRPSLEGIGRIKGDVVFKEKKIVTKGSYTLFGCKIEGYEIHNGYAVKIAEETKNCYGTFVHGLFDSDTFRFKLFSMINSEYRGYDFKAYKRRSISDFADFIDASIDMDTIEKSLMESNL